MDCRTATKGDAESGPFAPKIPVSTNGDLVKNDAASSIPSHAPLYGSRWPTSQVRQKMTSNRDKSAGLRPFRHAVLRGLGVALPPLLTIVLLLWVGNSVRRYILEPFEWAARRTLVRQFADIRDSIPDDVHVDENNRFELDAVPYVRLKSGKAVPLEVYQTVKQNPGNEFPTTALAVYDRYVEVQWLKPFYFFPVVFCAVILVFYLLGKLIAARLGAVLWEQVELVIHRVPLISTVYATVKQVTDIVFGDSNVEYTRVVAVEYPRHGLWSIGFVTGESMQALRDQADEPVLSVLIPTSPMPATGFTITVRRSEAIDLGITVDQAFQFIVSCGVVSPKTGQSTEEVRRTIQAALGNQPGDDGPPPMTPTQTGVQ